ncbi:MAG: hypothetical protein IDH49_01685 [Gammaproteobacteria bacterium]|nr:hypothetical protein [Gammaproteobacteria bacterium]
MLSLVRILMLGGIVGKVIGVLRELVFAWLYGTGAVSAAYRMAQAAFLMPLHGFVSETVNSAFTPAFANHRGSNPERAQALFSGLHAILLCISVVVAVLIMVFAPWWIKLLAPGFDPRTAELSILMLRVMAVAMPAYVLSGLYAATRMAQGYGAMSAWRATAQSIGLLAGSIIAWVLDVPVLIAVGFLGAYIVMLVWGTLSIRRSGLTLFPAIGEWRACLDPLHGVWRIFKILVWVPIVLLLYSIIERRVASVVSPDAVAALDYSRFVTDTMVILIASPFAMAGLSAMVTMGVEDYRRTAIKSMRIMLLIGMPMSALFFVHAEAIIRILFARGAFDEDSVQVTSAIFGPMSLGIWGTLVGYAGARFLSARGQNSQVLKITVIGVIGGLLVNLFGVQLFGVSVLGVAALVNGMIIGGLGIWATGVWAGVRKDCLLFGAASGIYIFLWFQSGLNDHAGLLMTTVVATVFWSLVLLFPRNRELVSNIIVLLRKKI